MTTDDQFLRLPKHAQGTIMDLRRELREARSKIKDLEAELTGDRTTDSRIFYSEGVSLDRRPLPSRAYIDFRLHHPERPNRGWELRAMVRDDGDGDVYVDINGDSTITVTPMASNSIQLRLKDRFQ